MTKHQNISKNTKNMEYINYFRLQINLGLSQQQKNEKILEPDQHKNVFGMNSLRKMHWVSPVTWDWIFLATLCYRYIFLILSKRSLRSHPTMIRKRQKKPKHARTHAHTHPTKRESGVSVHLREERFTWIYLLLDHLIRKM